MIHNIDTVINGVTSTNTSNTLDVTTTTTSVKVHKRRHQMVRHNTNTVSEGSEFHLMYDNVISVQQLTTKVAKQSEQCAATLLQRVFSSVVDIFTSLLAILLDKTIAVSASNRLPVVTYREHCLQLRHVSSCWQPSTL
jgi:hypothetical protein